MKTDTRIVTLPHEPAVGWPVFDAEDEAAVLRILRDGVVSTHPVIAELQEVAAGRGAKTRVGPGSAAAAGTIR